MNEPNWDELRGTLQGMTMREIKPIRAMFGASLAGATTKGETIQRMMSQLCYWWRENRGRAETIVAAIYPADALADHERRIAAIERTLDKTIKKKKGIE